MPAQPKHRAIGRRTPGLATLAFFLVAGIARPWPLPPAPAAEPTPALDGVTLKDGTSLDGVLLDATEAKVAIRIGAETRRFPRADVAEIRRGAPAKVVDFARKKIEEYARSPSLKSWKSLADFCSKKGLALERREALRNLLELDPTDIDARTELGHAQLDGAWVDEDEVEKKLREGYEVADGKLVKAATKTAVAKQEPEPSAYRILQHEKLTPTKRESLEKERQKRLKTAEAFLKKKQQEYVGVPWDKRFSRKTQNFEILCNSTREVTDAYGALMEMIRAELQKMFQSRILRNVRAPVFIYASQEDFMNQDEFARWGGRGLGGYYNPISQAITTYHGTFGFTGTTFGVLCHEGTHYYQGLVLQKFDNVPIWLVEGLAVYFGDGSTFDPDKKKISVGHIPRDRLAHIQEKMLVKRHTPIEKLVAMDRRSGFSGSHYADAWALIYFLVNSGKKGQDLLKTYWATGVQRELDKKDFQALAEKLFGSMEELEKQYIAYISKLEMPSAGKVLGDYFVSDTFQFEYKIPGDDWAFFEDKEDKKLLVGILKPGTSAEVRIYYENNIENSKADQFFAGYLQYVKSRYKDVTDAKVKISNLDGYKVTYLDEKSETVEIGDLSDLIRLRDQAGSLENATRKGKNRGPRRVVKFLLIQIDGVVTIDCSAKPDDLPRFADVFDRANESFVLTFTRRW